MGEIVDLLDKIKRYFKFTPLEIRGLIIATLVIAFIISFDEWGPGDTVEIGTGLFNLFNAILIVALSFLVHISVQRIWSLGTGYRLEWKMWSFGLLIGLILVLITRGKFWLILPGGFIVHHMAGHRLGWFRYGINYWAVGLIAVTGPFASTALAAIFKALSGFVFSPLIQKVIIFNIVYAVYSLLPIPPLDGSRTFYFPQNIDGIFPYVHVVVYILHRLCKGSDGKLACLEQCFLSPLLQINAFRPFPMRGSEQRYDSFQALRGLDLSQHLDKLARVTERNEF